MATNAMFIGWNRPVVGREKEAAEVFNASMAFWNKKLQAGEIEGFEPVLINRHGGDLNGFVLVKGDHNKLDAIVSSDEWHNLALKIDHAVLGYGRISAWVGKGVTEQMAAWMKMIAE